MRRDTLTTRSGMVWAQWEVIVVGLAWTLLLNGTLGLAGYGVARFGLRQPAGPPRILAAAILAWAWLTIGMQGLGVANLLARGPLLAWAGLGLGIAAIIRTLRGPQIDPKPASGEGWEVSAIMAVGLVLWAAAILTARSILLPVKIASDAPIYHLYFAARWWKEGGLGLIPTPFSESAAPYFPANGDLWLTWLTIGWGGDRLSRAGQAPFLLLSALAVYEMARRLGIGRSAAVVATAWYAGAEPILVFAFEANVDGILVAGYLVAIAFLMRYSLGDGGAGTLLIAALAAGLAWGTKASGLIFVPVLLAIAAVVVLARPISGRRRLAHLVALIAGSASMFGFWYGRSAWLTGNPLYPLQVSALGRVWLRGWFGSEVMRMSPFYLSPGDWRTLVDYLLTTFDSRLVPVWAAGLLGAWALSRGDRRAARWAVGCAVLSILNVALYWLLIPYRTQPRFMLHAVGLAAIPLARLFDLGRWPRRLAVGLLALHLFTPQTWPWIPISESLPWGLSRNMRSLTAGIIPLVRDWSNPAEGVYLFYLAGAGVVAFVTAAAWGLVIRSPSRGRRGRAMVATVVLFGGPLAYFELVFGASAATFPRYPDLQVGWARLDRVVGPVGARIAFAGTNMPYYLMGRGLRNDVRYVNVDAHRSWLLHDYHREAQARGEPNWPDTFPGWDRARPDYDAWLANLRADRIEYLFVATIDPKFGRFNCADAACFPIERVWADAHPEVFLPIHGAAEGDSHVRIYRVRSQRPRPGA